MLPWADAWIPWPSWTLHLHRWSYSWWAAVEPHSAPPGLLMIIRQRCPVILAMVVLHMVALSWEAFRLISLTRRRRWGRAKWTQCFISFWVDMRGSKGGVCTEKLTGGWNRIIQPLADREWWSVGQKLKIWTSLETSTGLCWQKVKLFIGLALLSNKMIQSTLHKH